MSILGGNTYHSCLSALVVAVAILAGGLCCGQEPIHVAVNLVNVAFSVQVAGGALLDNLSKEDVEVYEDAVRQRISFFAKSMDVPLTLGLIVDVSGSPDRFSKEHEHELEVLVKEVLGRKERVTLLSFENDPRRRSDSSASGQALLDR